MFTEVSGEFVWACETPRAAGPRACIRFLTWNNKQKLSKKLRQKRKPFVKTTKLQKNNVLESIFGYMASHIECRFNRNSLLQYYFLAILLAGLHIVSAFLCMHHYILNADSTLELFFKHFYRLSLSQSQQKTNYRGGKAITKIITYTLLKK